MARTWALVENGAIIGLVPSPLTPGVDVSAVFLCVEVTQFPGCERGWTWDGERAAPPVIYIPPRNVRGEIGMMRVKHEQGGVLFRPSGAAEPAPFGIYMVADQIAMLAACAAVRAGLWPDGMSYRDMNRGRHRFTAADVLALADLCFAFIAACARREDELLALADDTTLDVTTGWPDRAMPDAPAPAQPIEPPAPPAPSEP